MWEYFNCVRESVSTCMCVCVYFIKLYDDSGFMCACER